MSTINNKRTQKDFYFNIIYIYITRENSFKVKIRAYLSQHICKTKYLDKCSLILRIF